MKTLKPEDISHKELHSMLLSCICPRPIALVATVGSDGNRNLSPFSFFNVFSSDPPVIVFSPAYRATDFTAKDTFLNLKANGECTVSSVNFAMLEQISLASCNYPSSVDEFVKSGLTPLKSIEICPPGVAESPFVMECRLLQHVELESEAPGRGNLMVCEIIRIHINEAVYDGEVIDPNRVDLVARMGYNWYCRASGDAVFEVPKPRWNGIGFDSLPQYILQSEVLTGNDLAKLAGVKALPEIDENFLLQIEMLPKSDLEIELRLGSASSALASAIFGDKSKFREPLWKILHKIAQLYLKNYQIQSAWQVLLMPQSQISY